jgi:ectoine hydroxylase-related dioxygenase (phytanoyl-CoA dioxygenase family)
MSDATGEVATTTSSTDTSLPPRRSLGELPRRDWAAAAQVLAADGVVRLEGALTRDALQAVEAAVEHSLAHPTEGAVNFYPDDDAKFFQDTGQNYRPLVRRIGLDTMVSALWGEPRLWYMGEQLFLKEGGHSRRTPWHQDTSYLRMRGEQMVACWITLDPLPRRHCLEFVRGSHTGTLYNGSSFSPHDDTAPLYPNSPLPRLPDIEAHRDDYDIVSWDLEPGDVLVFHLGILHGGGGTEPGVRRRTASLRFMGPDVVYDARLRDRRGVKAGNDAKLSGIYDQLEDGQPFHALDMFKPL